MSTFTVLYNHLEYEPRLNTSSRRKVDLFLSIGTEILFTLFRHLSICQHLKNVILRVVKEKHLI